MNIFKSFAQLTMLSIGLGLVIEANDSQELEFFIRVVGLILVFIALDWRYEYREQ